MNSPSATAVFKRFFLLLRSFDSSPVTDFTDPSALHSFCRLVDSRISLASVKDKLATNETNLDASRNNKKNNVTMWNVANMEWHVLQSFTPDEETTAEYATKTLLEL